jgi:hypothetical protein
MLACDKPMLATPVKRSARFRFFRRYAARSLSIRRWSRP